MLEGLFNLELYEKLMLDFNEMADAHKQTVLKRTEWLLAMTAPAVVKAQKPENVI